VCVWEPLASDDHPPPLQSTACCCCTRGLLAGKVSKAPALRLVTVVEEVGLLALIHGNLSYTQVTVIAPHTTHKEIYQAFHMHKRHTCVVFLYSFCLLVPNRRITCANSY
jgi:hypothetical protein